MQEGLTIQGDISDLPVPEILRSLLKNEGISSLSINKNYFTYSVYTKNGSIVYATSDDPDLMLSTVLLKYGEIDLESYNRCREQYQADRSEGKLLVQLDIISPDGLIHAVEKQVKEILLEIFNWREGRYTMVFDDQLPEDGIIVNINTDETVLEAMRTISWWSLLKRGVGGMRKIYQKTPNMDVRFYSLNLNEDEGHIYSLLESPRQVKEICQMSYLSDYLSMRYLWALKCINLAEEVMAPTPEEKTSQADEYAWASIVESYNNAFAALYALIHEELGDEMEEFLTHMCNDLGDEVKKHMGECSFSNEGRLDFDLMYNNLVSDQVENLSQAFQDIMNDILYTWVFHIRQRFGDKFNTSLDSVINAIHEE